MSLPRAALPRRVATWRQVSRLWPLGRHESAKDVGAYYQDSLVADGLWRPSNYSLPRSLTGSGRENRPDSTMREISDE
jgi:hypothetical protein